MSHTDPLDLYRTDSDLLPPVDPLSPEALRAPDRKAPKKRVATSPTQRSLKLLRAEGYLCQVVEQWNPWARVRVDLFGLIDILAIRDGEIVGVQATTGENVSHRAAKIAEHENTGAIRKAGIRLVIHGWRTVGGHGSKKWECRIVDCS